MIVPLAALGLLLSLYAVWVLNNMSDPKYRPFCDIKENVSCTKAFGSKEGSSAALPNPIYGLIYYVGILALVMYAPLFVQALAILGAILSLYLMHISYIKQKNFCVVCTAIYIINFLLVYYSF